MLAELALLSGVSQLTWAESVTPDSTAGTFAGTDLVKLALAGSTGFAGTEGQLAGTKDKENKRIVARLPNEKSSSGIPAPREGAPPSILPLYRRSFVDQSPHNGGANAAHALVSGISNDTTKRHFDEISFGSFNVPLGNAAPDWNDASRCSRRHSDLAESRPRPRWQDRLYGPLIPAGGLSK